MSKEETKRGKDLEHKVKISQFLHFGNGVFEDQQTAKGVLGCKLNLGKTLPNKVLWVFIAHLQTNPKDQTVQNSHVDKIRKGQLERCLQLIKERVFTKDAKDLVDVGVILCGDFNIVGEVDLETNEPSEVDTPDVNKKRNKKVKTGEEAPVDVNSTLQNLANKISQNTALIDSQNEPIDDKRIRCIQDVYQLLKAERLPISSITMLRNALPEPRNKLMVLMAMTWLVIRELALEHMKKSGGTQENAKQVYRNVILYTLQLLFASPNLDVEKPFYSVGNSGADADSEFDGFWKLVHEKLIVSYQAGLLPHEVKSDFSLFKQLHVLRYQLFKIFQDQMNIVLKQSSKERILQGDEHAPVITMDDFTDIDFQPLNSLWAEYLAFVTPESSVLAAVNQTYERGQLVDTDEYRTILSTFKSAQDVYRKLHPNVVGYTLMNKQPPAKKRIDFMFTWNTFGESPKELKLLSLQPEKCEVSAFGEVGDNNHFGLMTKFNILSK